LPIADDMIDLAVNSLKKVSNYCEREDFAGWDPFDGLNSKVFQAVPGIRASRWCRLGWVQMFKRMPVNLRRPLLVPGGWNPKGLGLFISGYSRLYQAGGNPGHLDKLKLLIDRVLRLQSNGWSGCCWGYNFPWQAKAFYIPPFVPTVVASSYVGCALLDAFHVLKDESLLECARSSCDFVLQDLNRNSDKDGSFGVSYSPVDRSTVYNASLLAAKLLSRVYQHTRETELKEAAEKLASFCCKYQRSDGSWIYGAADHHGWVDSFHTGYNLESLGCYARCCEDSSFSGRLTRGLDYYLRTFFTEEGIPKYYHDKIYPIDPHCAAQLFITLCRLGIIREHLPLVGRVLEWTVNNMQSGDGWFYYQINRLGAVKIPYMRWTQAWMFLGLSCLVGEFADEADKVAELSHRRSDHGSNGGASGRGDSIPATNPPLRGKCGQVGEYPTG